MSTPTGGGANDSRKPGSNAPGRGHEKEAFTLTKTSSQRCQSRAEESQACPATEDSPSGNAFRTNCSFPAAFGQSERGIPADSMIHLHACTNCRRGNGRYQEYIRLEHDMDKEAFPAHSSTALVPTDCQFQLSMKEIVGSIRRIFDSVYQLLDMDC